VIPYGTQSEDAARFCPSLRGEQVKLCPLFSVLVTAGVPGHPRFSTAAPKGIDARHSAAHGN
jgi:hypothetical protein